MNKTFLRNTMYASALVLTLALASCRDTKPNDGSPDMDMTTDSIAPSNSNDMDMDSTTDSTAVNPDTIMGP